jgi:hypothetical protein
MGERADMNRIIEIVGVVALAVVLWVLGGGPVPW